MKDNKVIIAMLYLIGTLIVGPLLAILVHPVLLILMPVITVLGFRFGVEWYFEEENITL